MGILNYRHVPKGIPIESILDVNTFLMCSTWNISKEASGALIGQAAQAAGLGDFWSSIAGTLTSAAISDTDAGLENIGNIMIMHDGHTTSTELVGFNMEQVKADFAEFKNQFITERLAEGATMQEAEAESKEIDADARQTKAKLKDSAEESHKKIEKIIPKKTLSEDEMDNLYAAIYDDETSADQLIAFVDEIKQAAVRIEKIANDQKAKISNNSKFSSKVKKFLNDWVDFQVYQSNFEIQYEKENPSVPFLPGIFDAAAMYHDGALSGQEAAIEGLKNVASDAVVLAATFGVVKGGSALLKKGISAVAKGFMAPGVSVRQIRKLGVNVVEEGFNVNWKNPDITMRGMQYENFVAEELKQQGVSRLAPNTNTFDAFNPIFGHAISIKSLNTQTPARLADPRQMEHLLNSYVRKTKGFKGIPESVRQYKIMPSDIKIPEIRVGVPKETTMDQWLALQRSAMKAEQQGVKITFGIEK